MVKPTLRHRPLPPPAVEASGLVKRFATRTGPVEAVAGLDLAVASGERVAYIGPNGAGKSTSIKILTGILRPTAGQARVLGLVPWRQRRQLASRIGVLFGQRSQLWFELTPRQSFRMLGAIYGLDGAALRRRIDELGGLLDAADLFDSPVRSLSLGQRMRCELAACLLHDPQLLFLDEPTIGLDLLAKQRLRDLLVRLNEAATTTVFLTSHDVADIEHVARRVVVITDGRVIYDDSVAAMRRSLLAVKLIEVGLERSAPALELPGVQAMDAGPPGTLRLSVDTRATTIRAVLDTILDRCAVNDISVVDPPLEQVIGQIYRAAGGAASGAAGEPA